MAKTGKKRVRTRTRNRRKKTDGVISAQLHYMELRRRDEQIKSLQERLASESKLDYERSQAARAQDEDIKRLKRDLGFARIRCEASDTAIMTLTRLLRDANDECVMGVDWLREGAKLATQQNDREIHADTHHPDRSWRDPRGFKARHHDDGAIQAGLEALRTPMAFPAIAAKDAERLAFRQNIARVMGPEVMKIAGRCASCGGDMKTADAEFSHRGVCSFRCAEWAEDNIGPEPDTSPFVLPPLHPKFKEEMFGKPKRTRTRNRRKKASAK